MKQLTVNRKLALYSGMLLAFPAAWFILISILKFEVGYGSLYDSSWPLLESLGIKDAPGFNINLLILFGPVLAIGLNLVSILRINWANANDHFSISLSVKKRWANVALVFISGLVMCMLIGYAIGENISDVFKTSGI